MQEIGRELRQQADLDLGPMLPLDEIFSGYDPGAHLTDDLFQNKLAFVVQPGTAVVGGAITPASLSLLRRPGTAAPPAA